MGISSTGKNELIRLGLKLFGRKKQFSERLDRILVVTTTALGDTLWAIPALESLRHSFPAAYIAVMTSPIGEEALRYNPWTDQVDLFPKWPEEFDTVLIFHASQRLALPLAAASGAVRIVGTKGINKGWDDLLTHPLAPCYQHEIQRRLAMVEAIGGRVVSERLSFFLQPEERKVELPAEGAWVGLHPGSKDLFKRWPASHFAEVGRYLRNQGYQILISGTKEERELMREVQKEVPGSYLIPENLSLRSFAAILEKLSLFISNDTGPVHLACALQRPVIAIYTATDPNLCGPHLASQAVAISSSPTCSPCLKKKCRAPFCLLQISPSCVIDCVKKILLLN